MKKDIHPKYYSNAKITCSCGNSFEVGSTQKELEVEVCSDCHPFYTGTARFIDTAGRVDKFKEKVKKAKDLQTKTKNKVKTKEKKDKKQQEK